MANLQDLNLGYNPFQDITPSNSTKPLIWADMENVKAKIERSYNETLQNDSKQMVLNWGPYGGGKTFSAYYFRNKYNSVPSVTHIYLRCPKEGGKATDELFKGIIDDLSFDRLCQQVTQLLSSFGNEEKLIEYLIPKASKEYAKAICLLASQDSTVLELMNRFLYSGLTKSELKKLGLAKDIQTDTDSVKFLSGLLSCFASDSPKFEGKVIIWLDEMEDLIYFPPKFYKAFSQILRDLFDSISTNFLIVFNFTLAEGEDTTIELILGGAIWSRITRKIRFQQFTLDNATNYINQLLEHAKITKKIPKPFDDEIIERILNLIPINTLTPREINKYFNSFINFIREEGAKVVVDVAMLNKWVVEYQEDN